MHAEDFVAFDEFLARSPYVEVSEKRSSHKRTYMRNGILVEVFVTKPVNGSSEQTVF
jgi:hypothetical protein